MSVTEPRTAKNNRESEAFRMKGNDFFGEKNYRDALHNYNRSICFAENGSKQLAIAYANRSAVYIDMKMFKQCLANIELARSIGRYPERLNEKLSAREVKCRALMATAICDIEPVEPVLSYPPHEKIPFVANCVEIRRNVKFGRHLVANRDLKVGDIVAIEKPFCAVVSGIHRHDRCENCTEEHARSLIPCESCTAVMFCSVECRTEAMQSYHQYECATIDFNKEAYSDPQDMVPVRLVLTALALFEGDTKALYDYAEGADLRSDDTTVFEIDYTKRLTPFGKFAPVYCMVNENEERHSTHVCAMKCINFTLYNCGFIGRMFEEPINKHLAKIMNHVRTLRSPSSRLHTTRDTTYCCALKSCQQEYEDISRAVYPLRFIFNHSCVPNVLATPFGNQLVITIKRPVRAGEQLFLSYCMPFYNCVRERRRRVVHSFLCLCDACNENYPLMKDLALSPIAIPDAIRQLLENAPTTRQESRAFAGMLADHLQTLDKYMPCKDWAMLSEAFWAAKMHMHEKENHAFLDMTY